MASNSEGLPDNDVIEGTLTLIDWDLLGEPNDLGTDFAATFSET